LQAGTADNDVLLYWPVHDLWHNPHGMLSGNTVSHRDWFENAPIGRLAKQLWHRGFAFDYVSDAQLTEAQADGKVIRLGGSYRALVVPSCEHMPVQTLAKLVALAEAGATIVFSEHLPSDVPGFGDLSTRQAQLRQLLARIKPGEARGGHRIAAIGKGCVLIGDPEAALAVAGVNRETMADSGMLFVRRAFEDGRHYFLVNRSERKVNGWLPLATPGNAAALLDPVSGTTGVAAIRPRSGGSEVFVQLEPGESVIVRLFPNGPLRGTPWRYREAVGDAVPLRGMWEVRFIAGGPELPPKFETDQLGSWTARGGEAERFAGTALYRVQFDTPPVFSDECLLDLGAVAQSARVRLNGRDFGTLFAPPFRIAVDGLKAKGNVLEVEVTNLSANRIRDLDRRGVKWRNFYDINFISLGGKPFDASHWPLADSGLLGPVILRSAERLMVK